jgi:hypothetical protein
MTRPWKRLSILLFLAVVVIPYAGSHVIAITLSAGELELSR